MLQVLGLGHPLQETQGGQRSPCQASLPLSLFLLGASFLSEKAGAELCVPSAQGPCSSCHMILGQSTHFPLSLHLPPLKKRTGQQGRLVLICLIRGVVGARGLTPRSILAFPEACGASLMQIQTLCHWCGVRSRIALLELWETCSGHTVSGRTRPETQVS